MVPSIGRVRRGFCEALHSRARSCARNAHAFPDGTCYAGAAAREVRARVTEVLMFGELLRRLREATYLTQAELAERAGLSRRGIQDLERGVRLAPHPATVRRLTEALQLDDAERAALTAACRQNVAADRAAVAAELARHPTNLPTPLTSFVGRERAAAEVLRLVQT